MNENWVLLRRVNVISLFYICSECLGDVILHQKKKDIPPQIPNTIAFFPVYRWGSTVVIQNVSQKFIFQRHRNRRSIWKKIQSGRMETVSSKSCDQEWLFTKCQHLKKVPTVEVSSWESNASWDREAKEGERNTTECKWLDGKQQSVVKYAKIFKLILVNFKRLHGVSNTSGQAQLALESSMTAAIKSLISLIISLIDKQYS